MAIDHLARAALGLAYVGTIAAYPHLSPEMPAVVAFSLPLTATAIWWLLEHLASHSVASRRRSGRAGALTALFLSAFHLTMLGAFIGASFWLARVLGCIVGLFLVITGNELPRLRPNLVWGIRTPQTLGSDVVWKRVHRVAGYVRVLMGCGVCGASVAGAQGFAELIPLALCVETLIGCAAGLVFSRQTATVTIHGLH
jgi:uncharacterized membrane protein